MHKTMFSLLVILLLAGGCSGSAGTGAPRSGSNACSLAGQKAFVLEAMRDVYFWNDLLPPDVDPDAFASAEDLLAYLVSFQPLDDYSYIDLASNDAQFFGAGQYVGYGFSSRFVDTDDLRFTRVFSSSPAALAGFARGQRIVMLDGRSIADVEANEGTDELFSQASLEFTVQRSDGSEITVNVDQDLVTIDPLPQWRVIDRADGTSAGYLELAAFISTADAEFDEIFAAFRQANVADIIIDLRYNGGGLVNTTELLGDYLGGAIASNLVFSRTIFNANNSFANRVRYFQRLLSSTTTSRLVVIATSRTASASELITNSMMPHVAVSIVGETTYGKPVGQIGIEFCDKILRPTAFESLNANFEGGYFDGIPVDCPADDELSVAIGDDEDPNMIAALTLLETGACPLIASGLQRKEKPKVGVSARDDWRATPWRKIADAW